MKAHLNLAVASTVYRRARRPPSKLASARNSSSPSKELTIAKTFLAGLGTLVTVWVRTITSQPLAPAVVARLGRSLH